MEGEASATQRVGENLRLITLGTNGPTQETHWIKPYIIYGSFCKSSSRSLLRLVIRLCAMHSTPGDKEQASGGEAVGGTQRHDPLHILSSIMSFY